MINIFKFLEKNNIKFQTEKKAINWIKKLKPSSLFRIGNSYFADEQELFELLQGYADKQIKQRKRLKNIRSKQARKNFEKSKLSFVKRLEQSE